MSNNKDVKRGIVLYIDGKEVTNNVVAIKAEIKKLTKELDNMTIGSREYQEQMAKIKNLNSILKEHRKEIRATNDEVKKSTFSLGKLVDGFNRFGGFIVSIIGMLTGVTLALRSIRDERNKLESSQASLKALTGLDEDSVAWLTEQAKQLSTTMTEEGLRVRSSAQEILDAFMLVGSAKPELLGNKEALKQVTEEAMRLQAAAGDITLNEAVDSLTLSLNQYGDASDQAARYANVLAAGSKAGAANIASQAKAIRNAGTAAASANVPIEQTVALIETLAYRGIKDEVAGTGLKKLFLTLQTGADETNPKIVGLDKALENLKNKNMDAASIKKMFGEEGYNTASVILQNTEMVKDFTKAVTGTNTAIEQAAINSDTAAARLDQARNKMKLAAIDLAERLNPALTVSTNLLTNMVRYLPGLIDWFEKWGGVIVDLTAVIVLYTAVTKAQIIQDKLTVFWKQRVIATTKVLYATIAKHPYAALGMAVIALVSYLRHMNKELSESERIERTLGKIRKDSASAIVDERDELKTMLEIARDEKRTKEEREAAIRKINELSPEYLGNITLEEINTQKATAAVNRYVDSLILLEEIKQAQDKKTALRRQQEDILDNGANYSYFEQFVAGAAKTLNDMKAAAGLPLDKWASGVIDAYANKGVNQVRSIENELAALDKHIADAKQKLIELETKTTTVNPLVTTQTDAGDGDPYKEKLAKAEAEYYDKIAQIKKEYLDNDKMTQQEYNQQMQDAERELLDAKLAIYEKDPEKRRQILNKILDFELKAREELRKADEQAAKDAEDLRKKESETAFTQREKQYQLEVEAATMAHYKEKTSEQAFLDELRRLQTDYYNQVLSDTTIGEDKKSEIRKRMRKQELTDAEKAALEEKDIETDKFNTLKDLAVGFGQSMAEFFTDTETDLGDFLKNILKMMLDSLEKMMIMAVTERTIKNVGTLGWLGLAKAAGEIALITAAFETAKGLIGNFYTGGYTGSGEWDEPQGIVHSNEFVANRYAVANPAIRPVLDLINNAQRTGSVANITREDIAAVAGTPATRVQAPAPQVVVTPASQTDGKAAATLEELTAVVRLLKARLDEPFNTINVISGRDGLKAKLDEYDTLINNVSRKKNV